MTQNYWLFNEVGCIIEVVANMGLIVRKVLKITVVVCKKKNNLLTLLSSAKQCVYEEDS